MAKNGRTGRPRLPVTPIERIFQEHGITREELLKVTRYSRNYVVGILRGKEELAPRFVGTVAAHWPELVEPLTELLEGES